MNNPHKILFPRNLRRDKFSKMIRAREHMKKFKLLKYTLKILKSQHINNNEQGIILSYRNNDNKSSIIK